MSNYYKKLLGERVYLSPVNPEDMDKFVTWLNDMQVTDYIGRTHYVQNYVNEKRWIEEELAKGEYFFEIVTVDGDEAIGNISLKDVDLINRRATLGILIGESDSRNKGYGTEAIRLLLDYAFNYLNLNNVMLVYLECNERAKRCYEKVGFKEFGRRRMSKFLNGRYYDDVYMDILATEFKESYIKNKNVK